MPITNFSKLLDDVLNEKDEAFLEWYQHTKSKNFNEEEINQTLQAINTILSNSNHTLKANALNLCAYMHQYGLGGEQNYLEAIRLYEEAIKLGNVIAMNNRASMHYDGLGGETNYVAATLLLDQALRLCDDNPNRVIITHRAHLYVAEKDYSKAMEFYNRAIDLGYTSAIPYCEKLQILIDNERYPLVKQYMENRDGALKIISKEQKVAVLTEVAQKINDASTIDKLTEFYEALTQKERLSPYFKKERDFFRQQSGMTSSWQRVLDLIKTRAMEIAKKEYGVEPENFANNQSKYENIFKIHRSRVGFGKPDRLEEFERLVTSFNKSNP